LFYTIIDTRAWYFRFGTVEDKLGAGLCKKLHAIGWRVSHVAVVSNEIDSVAEEVERCKSTDDMVSLSTFSFYEVFGLIMCVMIFTLYFRCFLLEDLGLYIQTFRWLALQKHLEFVWCVH
jgi:hypothetical protein